MSIQEYIEEHGLGKKVEDVINAAVKAKAPEPIAFMVWSSENALNRNVDLCSISLHDSSHIFFQRLALNSLTNGAGVYPEFLGCIPA